VLKISILSLMFPNIGFPAANFVVFEEANQLAAAMSTGWPKKVSRKLLSISSPNINRFSIFFTSTFCGKFVVKLLQNMPPHFNCVATLPCEI